MTAASCCEHVPLNAREYRYSGEIQPQCTSGFYPASPAGSWSKVYGSQVPNVPDSYPTHSSDSSNVSLQLARTTGKVNLFITWL